MDIDEYFKQPSIKALIPLAEDFKQFKQLASTEKGKFFLQYASAPGFFWSHKMHPEISPFNKAVLFPNVTKLSEVCGDIVYKVSDPNNHRRTPGAFIHAPREKKVGDPLKYEWAKKQLGKSFVHAHVAVKLKPDMLTGDHVSSISLIPANVKGAWFVNCSYGSWPGIDLLAIVYEIDVKISVK